MQRTLQCFSFQVNQMKLDRYFLPSLFDDFVIGIVSAYDNYYHFCFDQTNNAAVLTSFDLLDELFHYYSLLLKMDKWRMTL